MKTLKQLRTYLGLNQPEVAKKINVAVSTYSLYENGQAIPCVEDMIILESNFDQRIKWADSITKEDKRQIMEALTSLSENYPLTAVLNFAQKALRDGIRAGKPNVIISHYDKVSKNMDIEPLLPTDIY
jgi:transcriptional regulator with XRE-family HTH domain